MSTNEMGRWYDIIIGDDIVRQEECKPMSMLRLLELRQKYLDCCQISLEEFAQSYGTDNFRVMCEKLFLEPISVAGMNSIIKMMNKNGWTAEALYAEHLLIHNTKKRITRIVGIPCKYKYKV